MLVCLPVVYLRCSAAFLLWRCSAAALRRLCGGWARRRLGFGSVVRATQTAFAMAQEEVLEDDQDALYEMTYAEFLEVLAHLAEVRGLARSSCTRAGSRAGSHISARMQAMGQRDRQTDPE